MDREAWGDTIQGVTKSQMQLSNRTATISTIPQLKQTKTTQLVQMNSELQNPHFPSIVPLQLHQLQNRLKLSTYIKGQEKYQ